MSSRPFLVLTICLAALAASLALYLWQLRRGLQPETSSPVAPPPARSSARESSKQVTLWVAQDTKGVLHPEAATIDLAKERQRMAEDILRALLSVYTSKDSPHRLSAGSEIRNVYFVEPGLVVVDLNPEFAEGQTSGVLAEELTVTSLVQTLSANFQSISQVRFLVNGKQADTLAGHADLGATYDVSHVSELVKQLAE